MIYEFALEPNILHEAASTPRDSRSFIDYFSLGAPAVISNFPSFKWLRRYVLQGQSTDAGDLERARLDEIVSFIGEQVRVKRPSNYDGCKSWRENTAQENQRVAFDHILTSEVDAELDSLTLSKIFEGELNYPSQLLVRRTAAEMASAVSSMLRISSRLVFIDPYFDDRSRKWNPFLAFLDAAMNKRVSDNLDILVVYGADKDRSAAPDFLANKLAKSGIKLPDCCSVSFRSIREIPDGEKLHNRYVLSDVGGMSFGIGLDEEDESHQDDVFLLDDQKYRLRWSQYVEMEGFELVGEYTL